MPGRRSCDDPTLHPLLAFLIAGWPGVLIYLLFCASGGHHHHDGCC